MIALETLCVEQVHGRADDTWTKEADKTFKLVNAMLDVLDRDGLYGAVLYLRAYDKSGNGPIILSAFNTMLKQMGLVQAGFALPAKVDEHNLAQVHLTYGQHLSGDDPASLLAEMAMKRLLIHLRFATKGQPA